MSMNSGYFIDLFSGCGGLSLGLSMAGLQGLFAVERDPMAFATFEDNFLSARKVPISKFEWPSWLEKKAIGIDDLLSQHLENLLDLKDKVDVLAGGPPCQGFSFAGKREADDPRNQLFKRYVRVVAAVMPKMIVLENVPGMRVAHISKNPSQNERSSLRESYFEKLKKSLESLGYRVHGEIVDCTGFGVPQRRSRLIVVGVRDDLAMFFPDGVQTVFPRIDVARKEQIRQMGISTPVTAKQAISDLQSEFAILKPCEDPSSRAGFLEATYFGPDTRYQQLMHKGVRGLAMDSMRMARHSQEVAARFQKILKECRSGVRMDEADRARFGLRKHRIHPMAADDPAPTITTLPDDVLHYSEPRILTIRESARLQSFPDWFHFKGKFTTGGLARKKECPRYTQVGNAVPPLLARAIGMALKGMIAEYDDYVLSKAKQRGIGGEHRQILAA